MTATYINQASGNSSVIVKVQWDIHFHQMQETILDIGCIDRDLSISRKDLE